MNNALSTKNINLLFKVFFILAVCFTFFKAQAVDSYISNTIAVDTPAPNFHAERVLGPTGTQALNSDYSATSQKASKVSLYRYWNSTIGDHMYTTNWGEMGSGQNGWIYEGIEGQIFSSPAANTVPLYRYWNITIGDHFYTTNWGEMGSGQNGWTYEGIVGYIHDTPASGTKPLYRYWNVTIGDHLYTTNYSELGSGKHGWVLEGIQGYIY
ncbi:hypothetical protein [Aliikangiella maris]|uniref:DUF5648 domain-containing protein n=2 Tax=Aliikangiella maris TaxID=3162458 RepID=A0ABV3MU76_9GAMM